jgi:hypothetical protein
MGPKLRIVNWIVAALFVISAWLQLNDPDPWGWVAIYLAAGIACLVAERGQRGWWLAAGVALASLIWAAALSPILPEVRLGDLAKTMKAESPQIELGRELLGLLIIFGWMVWLTVVGRRTATS